MSDFLKGTYKINTEIVDECEKDGDLDSEFRKKALNSIGGSMVFVERNKFVWTGEDENEPKE
ncbi:MAG: hypothetical protein HY272_01095 [Gammaproteobacteria bacterium]|nr:hypothetical protein [Gammaproteobacteria bacterium]